MTQYSNQGDGAPDEDVLFSGSELSALNDISQIILRSYTCSIYVNKNRPRPLGSGTVVSLGDYVAVATASHVLDSYELDELCVLGLYDEDPARFPVPKDGVRCIDEQIDIAAVMFLKEVLDGSRITGVPLQQLGCGVHHNPGTRFLVCGCPEEDFNRDDEVCTIDETYVPLGCLSLPCEKWPSTIEVHVETPPDPYSVGASPTGAPQRLRNIPVKRQRDIFLRYSRRHAFDHLRQPVPRTNPVGMSGGGIWVLPTRDCDKTVEPKLVGIAVSVKKQGWDWIRGVQIQHWLAMIVSRWPGLGETIRDAGL